MNKKIILILAVIILLIILLFFFMHTKRTFIYESDKCFDKKIRLEIDIDKNNFEGVITGELVKIDFGSVIFRELIIPSEEETTSGLSKRITYMSDSQKSEYIKSISSNTLKLITTTAYEIARDNGVTSYSPKNLISNKVQSEDELKDFSACLESNAEDFYSKLIEEYLKLGRSPSGFYPLFENVYSIK